MPEQTTAPIHHVPVSMPRITFPEATFLRLWQRLMEQPGMVDVVYGDWPEPVNQRAATVGASFVMWLGTNCGQGFIEDTEKFIESMPLGKSREAGFLAKWALENRRVKGVNSGLRIIEHILVMNPVRQDSRLVTGNPNWPAIADAAITIDDFDTIERVLVWLASYDGKQFLRGAALAAKGEMEVQQMIERNQS